MHVMLSKHMGCDTVALLGGITIGCSGVGVIQTWFSSHIGLLTIGGVVTHVGSLGRHIGSEMFPGGCVMHIGSFGRHIGNDTLPPGPPVSLPGIVMHTSESGRQIGCDILPPDIGGNGGVITAGQSTTCSV